MIVSPIWITREFKLSATQLVNEPEIAQTRGMSRTQRLAQLSASIRFEDLPEPVVERAKVILLDVVGCALSALPLPLAQAQMRIALTAFGGSSDEATLIGSGRRASIGAAAYGNASVATSLDQSDGYFGGAAYLWGGTLTVPAALAVGEEREVEGDRLLAAIVAGYEVGARLSDSFVFERSEDAVLAENVGGVIAAAVSVAKVLDLDSVQMLSAIGMASLLTPAATLRGYIGPGTQPVRDIKQALGWRCLGGVVAAQAATSGLQMTQPVNALDGDSGFWSMFQSTGIDESRLFDGFGDQFRILDTHTKRYPGGGMSHGAIELVRSLLSGFDMGEIERIDILLDAFLGAGVGSQTPKGVVDGQFSVPHQVAAALAGLPSAADWYLDSTFDEASIRELARRVFVIPDEECTDAYRNRRVFMTKARIRLVSGETLEGTVESPRKLHTDDEFEKKFLTSATPVIGESRAEEILDAVAGLDKGTSLKRLAGLLRDGPA